MQIAIDEARLDPRPHKVGAVVVLNGRELGQGHGDSDHAEATLLDQLKIDLRGATIYTTLEPCTRRGHPEKHCAALIKERGITRVVIGAPDPNPNITNSAELFFKRKGLGQILVEFAGPGFYEQIKKLMGEWFVLQEGRMSYAKLFSQVSVSPELANYIGPNVGTAKTLRLCPEVKRGWLMGETRLNDDSTVFQMPTELEQLYKSYFAANYETKGFERDNERFMLVEVPLSLSDTVRKISLKTKRSRYSYSLFCAEVIAADPVRRAGLIKEINDTEIIRTPHTFCLHLVVVTEDEKILITKRSPNLKWYPKTWACSIEEQLGIEDLSGGIDGAVLHWGKRALLEELGVDQISYSDENLRLLSVFLESDILNVSLCGYAALNISSAQLSDTIKRKPRKDNEFTDWSYVPNTDEALMAEILTNRLDREYHPTSRYRMLMALLKRNGLPVDSERFLGTCGG